MSYARRLMPFEGGNFSPSPPPPLLTKLTDYDLIVAKDAVWQVAAEKQPPPSGKARYRLLAWVVADARGASQPLAPAVAEKVGKRLEAQALKAQGRFSEERSRARDAAAADASLAAGLRAALAAIDEAERCAMEAARSEVYVGFHELEMPPPPPQAVPDGTAPDHAELDTALSRTERARAAAELAEREREQARELERQQALPDIPAELASALGPDGVQTLWCVATERCWSRHKIPESGDWWKMLPELVKSLIEDSAIKECEFQITHIQMKQAETRGWRRGRAEEIDLMVVEAKRRTEEAERRTEEAEEQEIELTQRLEASEAEVERLRLQLSEARGRESALEGVISRHIRT